MTPHKHPAPVVAGEGAAGAGPGPWRHEAACWGMPVDAFFPDKTDSRTAADAKAICRVCPVEDPCLAEALRIESLAPSRAFGIFGGLSPRQRRRLMAAA